MRQRSTCVNTDEGGWFAVRYCHTECSFVVDVHKLIAQYANLLVYGQVDAVIVKRRLAL